MHQHAAVGTHRNNRLVGGAIPQEINAAATGTATATGTVSLVSAQTAQQNAGREIVDANVAATVADNQF